MDKISFTQLIVSLHYFILMHECSHKACKEQEHINRLVNFITSFFMLILK